MQTMYYKNKVFEVVNETGSLITLRDPKGNEMIFEKDAVMRYLSAKKPIKHTPKPQIAEKPTDEKKISIEEFLKLREKMLALKKKKKKKKKVQKTELTLFDSIGGGT